MATEALAQAQRGLVGRVAEYLREVRAEIQKVTWPGVEELRKATLVIVVFVSLLGMVIGLMDLLLRLVLVNGVAVLVR